MTIATCDGRHLHAERAGHGPVTVIFEAGLGLSHHMWAEVVPLLADRATTVAYDRAGLGRSQTARGPRDLDNLVRDCVDVVDHVTADGSRPVVLVGHSWGGPIIRLVASDRPDVVAGLVLVDASDELCDMFFGKGSRFQMVLTRWFLLPAARLGLLRMGMRQLARGLPPDAAAAIVAENGTLAAARTQLAEMTGTLDDLALLRDDPPFLPDIRVSVITGTRTSRGGRARREALLVAHRRRAALSPRGRHVEADRSGHNIPVTEPGVVADEVLRIIHDLRS